MKRKTFFKGIQRVATLALAAGTCFSVTACGGGSGSGSGDGESTGDNLVVWTAPATFKIKQQDDYSHLQESKEVEVETFVNERVSAQIIMTAQEDVDTFTASVSELTDGKGNVIKGEEVDLYATKYINISSIKDSQTLTGAGNYPDALVPIDNYVASGENSIVAKENQGLWLAVKPAKGKTAGVYKGKVTIQADKESYEVEVAIDVLDYELSDVSHMKTSFGLGIDGVAYGELDSTPEMAEKYYEYLLDYRLSANSMPGFTNEINPSRRGTEIPRFIEAIAKYAADDRCSRYTLLYAREYFTDVPITETNQSGTLQTVHVGVMEELLRAMMEYSLENEINLFTKASTYYMWVDEYTGGIGKNWVNDIYTRSSTLYNRLADEYLSAWEEEGTLTDFKKECAEDLRDIRDLLTGPLIDMMQSKCSIVPTIDVYHTQEARDYYTEWLTQWYGDDVELWSYTCMNPDAPNPTYHIEDELLSSRLYSWMMYEYDIVGNLYWTTALYTQSSGLEANGHIQDFYQNALRFPAANGDGFLLYPGRLYGVDGPIGSIRLESIGDGNEEYDLMYALEEMYEERASAKGVAYNPDDFNSVLELLTSELYTGVMCKYQDGYLNNFDTSRAALNQLILMASKGVIVESAIKEKDSVKITLSAPVGTEVSFEGTDKKSTDANGITTHTFTVKLDQPSNYLKVSGGGQNLSVFLGGECKSFDLGALVEAGSMKITANRTIENLLKPSGTETVSDGVVTVVNAEVDGAQRKVVNLAYVPQSALKVGAVLDVSKQNVTKDSTRMYLQIYVSEDVSVTVKGQTVVGLYKTATNVKLQAGWNAIEVEMTTFNMAKDGNLKNIMLEIANEGLNAESFTMQLAGLQVV